MTASSTVITSSTFQTPPLSAHMFILIMPRLYLQERLASVQFEAQDEEFTDGYIGGRVFEPPSFGAAISVTSLKLK